MANADRPSGAKPIEFKNGAPWNGKINIYYVGSGDSTAIFRGDFVKLAGSADSTGLYSLYRGSAAARFPA